MYPIPLHHFGLISHRFRGSQCSLILYLVERLFESSFCMIILFGRVFKERLEQFNIEFDTN